MAGFSGFLDAVRERTTHRWAARRCRRTLRGNPANQTALRQLAELEQRAGRSTEAVMLLYELAERQIFEGHLLQAVATYRHAVSCLPQRPETHQRLAWLYEQLGLIRESARENQIVADQLEHAGDTEGALNAVKQQASLEPANIATRMRLGELYAKRGMAPEAMVAFRKAAQDLKRNNCWEACRQVLIRMEQLAPNDSALAREIAVELLSQRNAAGAITYLQKCVDTNPFDTKALELLSSAFVTLKEEEHRSRVMRTLAAAHARRSGREEEKSPNGMPSWLIVDGGASKRQYEARPALADELFDLHPR